MRFREFGLTITIAFGLLGAPLAVEAQQPGKVYRIGVLETIAASLTGRPMAGEIDSQSWPI